MKDDVSHLETTAHADVKGQSFPSGFEKMLIAVPAAVLFGLLADGFFSEFDICPICGGDGSIFRATTEDRTFPLNGDCPLLLIKPDWHGTTA